MTKTNVLSKLQESESQMVNQVEDEIIILHYKGEKYSFPWMNEDGKRNQVFLSLEDADEEMALITP